MDGAETSPGLPVPTQEERTMAMLSHLLMIFAGFIPPLVIYLVRKESKFVSFHAMQGLLWQIVTAIVYFFAFATFIVSMIFTMPHGGQKPAGPNPFPFAFFGLFALLWISFMGIWMANLILGIVYSIKAYEGKWASYPLFGRWARRIVGV